MKSISENTRKGFIARTLTLLFLAGLLCAPSSLAARPLITDDSGTMGKGKVQLETGVEVSSWKDTEDGVETKENITEASVALTYGLTESIDLVAGIPYAWRKVKEDGITVFDKNRFSDTSLEMKWRFFEKNGFGLALKPGITLPTGKYEDEFGSGRVTYGVTFIASKELDPFAFHVNVGYTRNENKLDERRDLWGASVAATYQVIKGLNVVGNVGLERNTDPERGTMPAFGLVGFNYAVTDYMVIDAGYKFGLNKQEVDHAVIVGLTFNF